MSKKTSIKKVTIDTSVEESRVIPNNLYEGPHPKFYMPSHPLATKNGKVSVSRHNASIKIGRWIHKDEVVVHLDKNPKNVAPDNLEVRVYIKFQPAKTIICDMSVKESEIIQFNQTHDNNQPYPKFYMPSHPLANDHGAVAVSRHNASIKIGRWLRDDEYVRFLDKNPKNVTLENLEVREKTGQTTTTCDYCGKEFRNYISQINKAKHHYCSLPCAHKGRRKLDAITPEELSRLVWEQPCPRLAVELNVSTTTIFNRCRKYGISRPPQNYWQRIYAGKLHDEALEECGYRDIGSEFVELEKIDW